MSATEAGNNSSNKDTADIIDQVRDYLATLPKKDGLDRAVNEGEQIATIVESLGLPTKIVAAVHYW